MRYSGFRAVLLATALLSAPAVLAAEDRGHARKHPAGGAAMSPYAGLSKRPIKALSEAEVADLEAGRGAGFALAAELNGYPGPRHVLDHAAELGLDPGQLSRTRTLFDEMKTEATALGNALVDEEKKLDQLFARKVITPQALTETTARIGEIRGTLRATHLRYHLATLDVLTTAQTQRYQEIRGYKPQSCNRK